MRRRSRPAVDVVAGEKVLAWAESADGAVVAGTRDALYVDGARVPWEQVESADWDRDQERLRVSEVGTWGEPRPVHTVTLPEPGNVLVLVRERVTASVVLQRHVPYAGPRGLRVIARRAPRGDRPVTWFVEYDQGVDPDDPDVQATVEAALAAARDEVGDTGPAAAEGDFS